jgi:transposase
MIADSLTEDTPFLDGEIEVDESTFGGRRKGKRGRGAAGKVPVFGLLKRGGKVHAVMVPDAKSKTLLGIMRQRILPDSVVYTDCFGSYDVLDVSEFHHHRINHSKALRSTETTSTGSRTFGTTRNAISLDTTASRKPTFPLFLKECEWRFNYRPTTDLLSTLRN